MRAWAVAVSAELTYENTDPLASDSEFVFPIASTAAVYKLEADINGRTIVGKIFEKSEALRKERDAGAAGRTSFFLENHFDAPDVYRLRIGALPLHTPVVIRVGYAQPVERTSNLSLSLTLPVVLNPRHVPGSGATADPARVRKQFHLKSGYVAVSQINYTMTFGGTVDMSGASRISDVRSGDFRDIILSKITSNKRRANFTLMSTFFQDHDFQFIVELERPFKPGVFIEPGMASSPHGYLTKHVGAAWFDSVVAFPDLSEFESQDEFWFVFDRSGLMVGDRIQLAKNTLSLFVRSLPYGCFFNIISFGTWYHEMFSTATKFSAQSLRQSQAEIDTFGADMGMTEIKRALEYIYVNASKQASGRRFIVLLTDGEVGDTYDIIQLVGRHNDTTRVFAIGIGEGSSTALVNGVAEATGGTSDFVRKTTDRLEEKVIDMLALMSGPSLEDVRLRWNFDDVEDDPSGVTMTPLNVPVASLSGRTISQYALVSLDSSADRIVGRVEITGIAGGSPVNHTISFDKPIVPFRGEDPLPLHRLSAKAMIKEMEGRNDLSLRRQIIQVSKATGVLSNFTSLLAVDSGTQKALTPNISSDSLNSRLSRPEDPFGPVLQPEVVDDDITSLIRLQQFNGYWEFSGSLLSTIKATRLAGLPLRQKKMNIRNAVRQTPGIRSRLRNELARRRRSTGTLVGISALRMTFPHREKAWRFIEGKGVAYLLRSHRDLSPSHIDQLTKSIGDNIGL